MHHHNMQLPNCYSRRETKKTPLMKHHHCLIPEVLQLEERKKKPWEKERKRAYLLKIRSLGIRMCGKHDRQNKGLAVE